ncbi:MAG TPA: translation initiation factor [Spirochaetota bacterium]|jgi:translation initiation factor 1|nr:MAG: translation initiation factor Sui1 [Spirochaetes bacterium ADurb.Bin133]HNZ28000.1 translation initiation factor [Spirochaetota bacterium]HPY88000.1 translation initiation factor [Spirochaetota bacterium]
MGEDKIVYSYSLGEVPTKYREFEEKNSKYSTRNDGVLRIRLEKNNRGGKIVTVIFGFVSNSDIEGLCKEIKTRCGCGGTVKEDRIELQGDKAEFVKKILIDKGYKVK